MTRVPVTLFPSTPAIQLDMLPGMAKHKSDAIIQNEQIEQTIKVLRGQRVILDEELARLYGVATKAINQAVKRNRCRFPADFAYQLTQEEVKLLRSQIVTAKPGSTMRRTRPWVFTEQGVAMLSSVLRSPRLSA